MNDLFVFDNLDYHRGRLLLEAAQERLVSQARLAQPVHPPLRLRVAARLRTLAQWVEPPTAAANCCPEPASA